MRRLKTICKIIAIVFLVIVAIRITVSLFNSAARNNIELYTYPAEMVGEFSLDDYQDTIEIFSTDKNIGPVEDLDDVTEKAQILWNEKFPFGGSDGPNPGDGIEVFFDSENACWLVRGTAPEGPFPPGVAGWTGAVPNIIIRENGDIVAIWMG